MFIDFCQILYSLSHLAGRLAMHIIKNADEYSLEKREKVCLCVCVVSTNNSPLLTQKAKFKWSAAYSVAIGLSSH